MASGWPAKLARRCMCPLPPVRIGRSSPGCWQRLQTWRQARTTAVASLWSPPSAPAARAAPAGTAGRRRLQGERQPATGSGSSGWRRRQGLAAAARRSAAVLQCSPAMPGHAAGDSHLAQASRVAFKSPQSAAGQTRALQCRRWMQGVSWGWNGASRGLGRAYMGQLIRCQPAHKLPSPDASFGSPPGIAASATVQPVPRQRHHTTLERQPPSPARLPGRHAKRFQLHGTCAASRDAARCQAPVAGLPRRRQWLPPRSSAVARPACLCEQRPAQGRGLRLGQGGQRQGATLQGHAAGRRLRSCHHCRQPLPPLPMPCPTSNAGAAGL